MVFRYIETQHDTTHVLQLKKHIIFLHAPIFRQWPVAKGMEWKMHLMAKGVERRTVRSLNLRCVWRIAQSI